MASDVLGVSISGLRVSQNAIRTTGHNIANANTDGYSRQTIDVNTAPANLGGGLYSGSGSYLSDIRRIVDEFTIGQVRSDTALSSELDTYNSFIKQVDELLANQATGLTQGFESFFSALQNVSDDPTSISSRQLVISEAQSLVDRFATLDSRLDSIQDNININISAVVETINTQAQKIADINQALSENYSSNSKGLPNDLLDQRDEALRELSKLVSIQVTPQDSNMVNVAISNGIQLVRDTSVTELEIRRNDFDASQLDVYLANNNITQPVTEFLTSGEIGALLDFNESVLKPTINEIGRLALVFSEQMNGLQQRGVTLNNRFGENLFSDINNDQQVTDRVLGNANNTTNDQVITLSITDTTSLNSSDYEFVINANASAYTIIRLDNKLEVSNGAIPALPASIEFDGLSLNLSSGTFSADDRFILQSTRFGARDIEVQSLLPEDLALGSPVATNAHLSNQGSGIISSGEVLELVDSSDQLLPIFSNEGSFTPPLLINFTTPTTYDILDNSDPGNPVQLDPPIRNQVYVSGLNNALFPTDTGQTTVVSGGSDIGLPAANTTNNGYDAETLTFTTTDPNSGATSVQAITTVANASAKTTAATLNNLAGVTANAFSYLEVNDISATFAAPLQLTLNGEDLVEYDGAVLSNDVPNPATNSGEDFNDYLASQINSNSNLQALGIYAVSAYDAASSSYYLQVHSTQGDNLTVGFESAASDTLDVNDGNNADVTITATGSGTTDTLVVGGSIDVTLASDVVMATTPTTSTLFGNSAAANFAQSSFIGIQANITGTPQEGDRFEIDFNSDAVSDNRNALAMAALQQENILSGETATLNNTYTGLIETVGIKANSAAENAQAAKTVLEQSINLRDSISGVNLDEEAANLIRYEQLYTANARVISVARELFDQLLNSF